MRTLLWHIRSIYSLGRYGWSFSLDQRFSVSRQVITPGEALDIGGKVVNKSPRIGTAYVILKISGSYDHDLIVFNSDNDVMKGELRLVDIPARLTRDFLITWRSPNDVAPGHYDLSIELWSPPKLFRKPHGFRFDSIPWQGAFLVADRNVASHLPHPLNVFISYAWQSSEHRKWVLQLADALKLNGISIVIDSVNLRPGEDIVLFMEKGIRDSDIVLLICSTAFTKKANSREAPSGVGYESILTSAVFFSERHKRRFIPIVRDNDLSLPEKTPFYLGSLKFIDMDRDDWRGQPFQELLDSLRFPHPPLL